MRTKRLASPAADQVTARDRLSEALERPELYLNRELSLPAFHRRILEEAQDPRHPLLERVKFLAMFASAIDEFSALRIATLKQQQQSKSNEPSPDGMNPTTQLGALHRHMEQLLAEQTQVSAQVFPALAEAGIELLSYDQLPESQRRAVAAHFQRDILPI